MLAFGSFGFSQTIPDDLNDRAISSSISNPDVYSFEKQSLRNVNYYTGTVDVSIPIYTIKSGNIEYPLVLSYNTGGIKVDQLASDVGLGWSLSKTIVTRTINQYNDFNNVGTNNLDNQYIQTAEESSKSFCIYGYGKGNMGYFLHKSINAGMDNIKRKVDFLPDTYNFHSSNSKSKFFFNTVTEPVELNPSGLKIEAIKAKQIINTNFFISAYPSGNQYLYEFPTQDFFTLKVTDTKGIRYTFNDLDFSANYNYTNRIDYMYSCGTSNATPAQVSAWHISQIEDTNSTKKINFEYDTTHSNPFTLNLTLENTFKKTQRSVNYVKIPASNVMENPYQGSCSSIYWTGSNNRWTIEENARVDVQKKRLKRIVFDEGEVLFYYNNNGITNPTIPNIREDIYNGDFLSKIVVKNFKNEIIKTIEFKYDYFVSDYNVGEYNSDGEFNAYRYKRLKLTEVLESGKNPYKIYYNESIKLPPVNSFSVDFLGYNNNSADCLNPAHLQTLKPNPKLYYYPNKYDKSLLPFPIPNNTYYTINGYFNREANTYSKAWSLNKIVYPTGGFSEFEFELNNFNIMGEDITGGGIRVKKQTLNDGITTNNRIIEYEYKNDSNKSSGSLDHFPVFGHQVRRFFDTYIVDTQENDEEVPLVDVPSSTNFSANPWKFFGKASVLEDITSGSYVGYSKVIEKEIGQGRRELKYTSNDTFEYRDKIYRLDGNDIFYVGYNYVSCCSCLSDFVVTNSGLGSEIFTDNSFKRGKIVEENIYNEANVLLKKTINNYQNFEQQNYIFWQPTTYPKNTTSENNIGTILSSKKKYKVANFLLTNKTETEYLNNSGVISKLSSYVYNDKGLITDFTENIIGADVKNTKIYYPNNATTTSSLPFGNITSNQLLGYQALILKNKISQPIQIDNFKNSIKVNTSRNLYDINSNIVFSNISQNSKGIDNPLENNLKNNLIDTSNGNVLETQLENGVITSYIWGYKKSFPVAVIDNVQYSAISTTLITAIQSATDTGSEAQLTTAFNNLRAAFPNAKIVTYSYKPLVGITSVIDEKGDKISYHYDMNNRLQFIKDKDGNILSENEYHYKN